MKKSLGVAAAALLMLGCALPPIEPSDQHLRAPQEAAKTTPPPALATRPAPPPPAARQPTRLYSVAVAAAPVSELLYAIARDAGLDIDIASDIDGIVTLNARDRTLPHLLDRIAAQVDMRWEVKDGVIRVQRDTPFLRNYRIDYINMSREASGSMSVASQVGGGGGGESSAGGDNNSSTNLSNTSNNNFWDTLISNVQDILRETDKILPDQAASVGGSGAAPAAPPLAGLAAAVGGAAVGAPTGGAPAGAPLGAAAAIGATPSVAAGARPVTFREAASVIANPVTGVISVRATSKQHEQVRSFLDRVLQNARRQVLIEATVVEVSLNQGSQTGVDWGRLASGAGFSIGSRGLGAGILNPGFGSDGINAVGDGRNFLFPGIDGTAPNRGVTVGYSNARNLAAAIKLLSEFGQVKVLSSPKITTLNNQPAVLRVVDNLVYFTIEADTTTPGTGPAVTTFTTTVNTVAVGFVMSVLPQIDDGEVVTLHVRPTITRLRGYARDPNPSLGTISNLIPIVQSKEMESLMKVPSGQMVMLGGLMEDSQNSNVETLPGLEHSPAAAAFGTRSTQVRKTELVIFLRPVVISDPSLDGDFSFVRNRLPSSDFFAPPVQPRVNGVEP